MGEHFVEDYIHQVEHHLYMFQVSQTDLNQCRRVTLVWDDPAGAKIAFGFFGIDWTNGVKGRLGMFFS